MLITFIDVVGRYFFDAPLTFAVELTELGMGLLVFFGLAVTTLNRGHISVDLVSGMVSTRIHTLLIRIAAVSGFIFMGLVAWRLWDRAANFMSDGLATQVLFLSVYPVVFVMAVSSAFAALIVLMQVFQPHQPKKED
jgi:TRAP-type C4-dicarboxylate transport system permease small subunit